MASIATGLPFWASSVVFSPEKNTKSLNVLQRKLGEVAHLWWQLGLQLKQHPALLDGFKSNPGKATIQEKIDKMLRYWIDKGEPRYRTWGALAKAVDESGNKALGKRVRRTEHYKEGSRVEMGLEELTNLLKQMTPQWKMLAINLGIPMRISDAIDNKLTVEDCLIKVLDKWLSTTDGDEEPTLEVLYKALESHSVANRRLAMNIVKDIEILELLTVSKKEEDNERVEEQLKRYIEELM